jgi:hypothetical protein
MYPLSVIPRTNVASRHSQSVASGKYPTNVSTSASHIQAFLPALDLHCSALQRFVSYCIERALHEAQSVALFPPNIKPASYFPG